MTLSLGTWLGVPGLPTVTLYKEITTASDKVNGITRENALPFIAGLIVDQFQKCLVALPIWFTLQVIISIVNLKILLSLTTLIFFDIHHH